MPKHSMFHPHIAWTKERLDEMDAALAALQRQAGEAQAASRVKADHLIADLRKRRDASQQAMNAQFRAGEAAEVRDRAQLESQWDGFAAEVNKYLEAFGKHVAVQQTLFRDMAAAQHKSWHDACEQMHGAATGFVAERRAEIERAAQRMKTDASKAEAQLQKKAAGAGTEPWASLNAALAESRTAFDRAIQAAAGLFKGAGEPGAENKPKGQPPR